jgi:adenine-specific DNA methylase
MLFSDVVFACASTGQALTSGGKTRKHHWGWIADNVRPKTLYWHNAEKLFHEKLVRALTVVLSQPRLLITDSIIERQDIRFLSVPDASVDLVVTSPPYLGMIDYALANRLTYLWFDWPIDEDREVEIGARFRRNRTRADVEYLNLMDLAAMKIARSLKGGGFCAIVIGASRKFPGMTQKVVEQFSHYLEPIRPPIVRTPSRRRVSDRSGSQFQELVCVFRK